MKNTVFAVAALKNRILAGIAGALTAIGTASAAEDRPEVVIADFEGTNYGAWTVAGEAFGPGPAQGTLPGQMAVDGFLGKRLVNSFYQGDGTTGQLTSPPFTVERSYIRFLIGGGGFAEKTCMNLLIDGKGVRTATGLNTQAGGSEHLELQSWDVREFAGKTAVLEIVDQATGGWGHINIDQITQTDRRLPGLIKDAARQMTFKKRYLNLPVKNGAPKRVMRVSVNGKTEREFEIELANGEPDWWAFMDLTSFKGAEAALIVDQLPEDSTGLKLIDQSDEIKGAEDLYHETLRPQIHFSQRRGWNNDPNGLVYYQGEYHLFFQHNPYGWNWGNMHWGHAVSKDLIHWKELSEALYPDALGTMFSGSAVVDWNNTSGLQTGSEKPIVCIFTGAGNLFSQGLAFSNDRGRTWKKYDKNPVVPQITNGNRDPKVYWHTPTKQWVMALYVEKDKRHTIHFLTSPNLKDWTVASQVEGFFECPDYFELPVDGNTANRKWVLTAASSEYMVGAFDGKTFTPETPKLKGQLGVGFYAAQTYCDVPAADGRRIQLGWMQAPSPGMPFNQSMTLPLELKLITTADGPRLTWAPAKETALLRAKSHNAGPLTLKPSDTTPLAEVRGELLELRAEFEPGAASVLNLKVRGVAISYDATKQELTVNGHHAPAPLRSGKQRLILYTDRTFFEVFASDGLTYVPMPVIPKAEDRSIEIAVSGDPVKFNTLEAHELRSIWK